MNAAELSVGGRRVAVSRHEKVLWPDAGITKGELCAYWATVADAAFPHLADRPLTLRRYPDGIEGGTFYAKSAPDYFPDWIPRLELAKRDGGTVAHPSAAEPAALVYLANQAALELHPANVRAGALDEPDQLIVDLDPPEGMDLAVLRAAARLLRDLCAEVGLTAFLKTSGSRGYHVVVPLDATAPTGEVAALAAGLAAEAARRDPGHLTTEFRKAGRGDRLYLDVGRNGYAQTAVAPYSPRALPGAPVATPLDWSELSAFGPRDHDLRSVVRRLAQKDDPWAGMPAAAGSAGAASARLGA